MEQKPIPTVAAGIKLICIGIALDLSDSFGLPVCSLQLVFTLCDYFCTLLCPWLYSTERFPEQ